MEVTMPILLDFSGHMLTVDASAGTVTGDMESVQLEPRVMDLLLCLAERDGELVDREFLLDRLWAGRVVTDDVLARCVYQLRRQIRQAIGADIEAVQTLRKRGYRLLVEARTRISESQPRLRMGASSRSRWAIAGLAGMLIGLATVSSLRTRNHANQPVSVAVLPFANISDDSSATYIGDGLADELIHQLAVVDKLKVVAKSSSFYFRDKGNDSRDIGHQLGVTHLIEGSVRVHGEDLRITADLIEAANGVQVWSKTYDTWMRNLFTAQQEIAMDVTKALHLDLATTAGSPVGVKTEAYLLYIQGRQYMHQRTAGSLAQAIDYFRQAIDSDPGFPRAYSGLADSYMLAWQYGGVELALATRAARTAVERALALNPNLPEAHASLGLIELQRGNYQAAAPHLRRATALDANYAMAHMWLGRSQALMGEFRRALAAFERAAQIDPMSTIINMNVGMLMCDMGNSAEGLQYLQGALRSGPEFANAYAALGYCHWLYGQPRAAAMAYAQASKLDPEMDSHAADLARVSLDLGDLAMANQSIVAAERQGGNSQASKITRLLMTTVIGDSAPGAKLPNCTAELDFWLTMRAGILFRQSDQIERSTACLAGAYSRDPMAFYMRRDLQLGFSFALWLARNYQRLGYTEQFENTLGDLKTELANLHDQGIRTPGQMYLNASLLAITGQQQAALTRLAEAIEAGWLHGWWMRLDPAWEDLRSNHRYRELLQRASMDSQTVPNAEPVAAKEAFHAPLMYAYLPNHPVEIAR